MKGLAIVLLVRNTLPFLLVRTNEMCRCVSRSASVFVDTIAFRGYIMDHGYRQWIRFVSSVAIVNGLISEIVSPATVEWTSDTIIIL